MKKLILIPLVIFLTSCGIAVSKYLTKDFEFGKEKTVNVGEAMLTVGAGNSNFKNDILSGTKFELVYGGIDHNVIQVDYREYSVGYDGAYIRDAFKQSVKYDLTGDNKIKYKTISMEVIKANSSSITFIVKDIEISETYKDVEWNTK